MNRRGWLAAMAACALPVALPAIPARAGCLFFCPANDEVPAARATETFERILGRPLPEGVRVLNMIDGGFQDRFIQVKLRATDDGMARLLALLKVAGGALGPLGDRQTAINDATWWDLDARPGLEGADAALPDFPYAFVARARDAADASASQATWTIYILAFQT